LTRYGRRRFRAVLDKIINANNQHPSDQGRRPTSLTVLIPRIDLAGNGDQCQTAAVEL